MTLSGFNMAMSASIVVVAYTIPLLGAGIVVVEAGMGDVGPRHIEWGKSNTKYHEALLQTLQRLLIKLFRGFCKALQRLFDQ